MMTHWGNGYVEYRGGEVIEFVNNGVIWFDATRCIARPGWREELDPYEGGPHRAMSFDEGVRFGLRHYGNRWLRLQIRFGWLLWVLGIRKER